MQRTRQRLIVIVSAVAIVAAAGVWALRPEVLTRTGPIIPTTFRVLSGPYSATYDFLTPSLGWAVVVDYSVFSTRFFVFRTTDGAAHWEKRYSGKAEGGQTYLHFFDDHNGFLYAGFTYRTIDGGDHWQLVEVPGPGPFVSFASPVDGWAEDFGPDSAHLFRTTNGGKTWTRIGAGLPAAAALQQIFETQSSTFRPSGEGWLGAFRQQCPSVFMTADGGTSWHTIELFCGFGTGYYSTTVKLIPGTAVVAFLSDDAGRQLGAFLSLDDGSSWAGLSFPFVVSPDELTFLDADHWWLFHSDWVYTTDDGGRSWLYLHALAFPGSSWRSDHARGIDPQHAWWALTSTANSEVGSLAMTSDGGQHWEMVNAPQP
jgi:photosystem II stability/assembly factor-like uncharacterized protein